MEIVKSKNGVPIRLTDERWLHIVENHEELAGHYEDVLICVEDPDFIIKGYRDALIALKKMGKKKFLAVVYKELSKFDGFIITAFFTTKIKLEKAEIIWQKQK
jgi:hypothetical protein